MGRNGGDLPVSRPLRSRSNSREALAELDSDDEGDGKPRRSAISKNVDENAYVAIVSAQLAQLERSGRTSVSNLCENNDKTTSSLAETVTSAGEASGKSGVSTAEQRRLRRAEIIKRVAEEQQRDKQDSKPVSAGTAKTPSQYPLPTQRDFEPPAASTDIPSSRSRQGSSGAGSELPTYTAANSADEDEDADGAAESVDSGSDSLDMFAESSSDDTGMLDKADIASSGKGKRAAGGARATDFAEVTDDTQGYFVVRPGETLFNGRYRVQGDFGRGMFGSVLRVIDTASPTQRELAIKMLRGNEEMRRRGLAEIEILNSLVKIDRTNSMHCLRLLDSFEERGHICLVTEAHSGGDLRAVLRQHGGRTGLSLNAVRSYAQQMLLSLRLCQKANIVHADVKLDNILVSSNKSTLYLADFGSAMNADDCSRPGMEPMPYLASRWYRAPEVVLGVPFSYEVDMWSLGCCIYELATNKVCFPGETNNGMLWMWMQVSGPFPKKLLKHGSLSEQNFEVYTGAFRRVRFDAATGGNYVQRVIVQRPTRDLRAEILQHAGASTPAQRNLVPHLADLLRRMFALDPEKRISVLEALKHPFFRDYVDASSVIV